MVGEKLGFVSRKFDIKNNQNGCEQYRGFQRLVFEGLGLFFLVEFVVFGGVVAATTVLRVMRTTTFFSVLTRRIIRLATFCIGKYTDSLQITLAKVFA